MITRQELPSDRSGIHEVKEKAFGQPQEARIVDKLRVPLQLRTANAPRGKERRDEAFMVRWLDTTLKGRASGVARYRDEFNDMI